jgi:predicted membrane protein
MENRKSFPWFPILLISAGGIFLLDSINIVDVDNIFELWPVLFILFGVQKLKDPSSNQRNTGIVLSILGIIFLIDNIVYLPWFIENKIFPLGLIGLGFFFLFHQKKIKSNSENEDFFSSHAFFSGNNRSITGNISHGDITVMFGGVELDISNITIIGEELVLNITNIFGGIELTVPEDVQVIVDITPILGGLEDKRKTIVASENQKTIRLIGFAMFSGTEIKSYPRENISAKI